MPYCIVYRDHSGAFHKISNPDLSAATACTLRWVAAAAADDCYCVIVLLFHSTISVLKIMSPSNEVRPFHYFSFCATDENCVVLYAVEMFK